MVTLNEEVMGHVGMMVMMCSVPVLYHLSGLASLLRTVSIFGAFV